MIKRKKVPRSAPSRFSWKRLLDGGHNRIAVRDGPPNAPPRSRLSPRVPQGRNSWSRDGPGWWKTLRKIFTGTILYKILDTTLGTILEKILKDHDLLDILAAIAPWAIQDPITFSLICIALIFVTIRHSKGGRS